MNKKIVFTIIVIALSVIGAISVQAYQNNKPLAKPDNTSKKTYEKEWKEVDAFVQKGLTKSALEVVETIYKSSKAESNAAQFIKAIIHRMKLKAYYEENFYEKNISSLNSEIKTAAYPITPVLHSILAECYWRYYERNRGKFYNRSQTVAFKNDDVSTWDAKILIDHVIKHYQLSLESPDKLKATKIELYDAVLTVNNASRKYRPTLYDFLAHRAVDMYMNQEPDITRPAYKFELSGEKYFSPYKKFASIDIQSKDSTSLKYYAIKILRDIIAFHAGDTSPEALIDVDLKRLKFAKAHSTSESKDSLYLAALKNLEKEFMDDSASTEISYEIAYYNYIEGLKYNPRQSEEYKWDKKKAYDICQKAIDRFPKAFGAQRCLNLQAQIKSKILKFDCEKINLPDKPFRAMFDYENINKIYLRIVQFDPEDFKKSRDYYDRKSLLKEYLAAKVIKQWNFSLPDDNDYQEHHTEIKMPELPLGYYIILASVDEKFQVDNESAVAYSSCWISDISYLDRRLEDGSHECYAIHRNDGSPIKAAAVQLWQFKYNYTSRKYEYLPGEKVVSNEDGYFKINPPAENNSGQYYLDFTNGNDRLFTGDQLYLYKGYNAPPTKQVKTFFFTDRLIYRPGQTVYFKGIMLESDGENNRILPGQSTKVTLHDVNSQQVAALDLKTNEYGTFSGSFIAPQEVFTGQMHITNMSGFVYFSVEEYKRPKFEVKVNPVKGSYKLGEQIKVEGTAKAYSGANIDGAEVKYRVVRNASFPGWMYYYYGKYFPKSPEIEITNGITTTNDTGTFNISFEAIPDHSISKKYLPSFNYSIFIDVTDLNGETRNTQGYVTVAYTALNLSIDIPEKINKGEQKKYAINTTNMMGEPEPATGTIEVYKLKQPERILRQRYWDKANKFTLTKEEYTTAFPNDIYLEENNKSTWERLQKVLDKKFDTQKEKEFALDGLASWSSGDYVIESKSKDKYGNEVKDIKYFTVYSLKNSSLFYRTPDWFVPVKVTAEPGEKAQFLLGSGYDKVKVLYEVEHKNNVVKKEWLTLNNEQKLIEISVEEKYRGNFSVHFTFIKNNRLYKHDEVVNVPRTNKELNIEFETFRNKLLPGAQEEWKIKIKDKKGDKVAAEMLATMYDASLDAFRPNSWYFNIYNSYYSVRNWNAGSMFQSVESMLEANWNHSPGSRSRTYERLNWFDLFNYYNNYSYIGEEYEIQGEGNKKEGKQRSMMQSAMSMKTDEAITDEKTADKPASPASDPQASIVPPSAKSRISAGEDISSVKTRKNFNETAFFYPQLATNENGEVIIKFTVPESLTRWKMMGFAHTKDLKYGQAINELVTQKELMVVPNAPRFFREGDKINFTAKITNLSDKDLEGKARIVIYDALSNKSENEIWAEDSKYNQLRSADFSVKKGQSSTVNFDFLIPEGISAFTYKIIAKAGNHSDGEEMTLPVLSNRMLVTESMPLPVRGKQTKTFRFEKLISQNNGSKTLRNQKLTLEYTSNPAWYAIQALPYLMEFPYECSEQTFSRYYANSIAANIANSSPKIKAVFDSWKNSPSSQGGPGGGSDALLSNLEKNQELKSLMLEETPWVLDAKDETERKKRIALLFDLNKMSYELSRSMTKLQKMQLPNGAWPWFEGMPDDRYITQYIVTGMGHLDRMEIKTIRDDGQTWSMINDALRYLDDRVREDYEWILAHTKPDENHIGSFQIQYLYARSYFKDIPVSQRNQNAFDYYKGQAQKFWLQNSRYLQGMIAIALNRYGNVKTAADIVKSLKQNSLNSEEMGMYWKENYEGYYWHQAPIESQALMIEVFNEVGNDKKAVEDLRIWLIKNKQTQDWKTTKATAEACYALLLNGTDILYTEPSVEITLGNIKINPIQIPDPSTSLGKAMKAEAGTGYFKTSWTGSEIKPEMGNITVSKSTEGIAWGAVYWQYFEQLDKITPHETPLKLNKKLFLEQSTVSGPVITPITETTALKPGDKLKVRIELRVDRNMEYVHMKDMRASGFEPTNVFSVYKWQDGLGYYESTRDAATNFFFSYLPKGTYVFEYPMVVTHSGDFSNGVTTIQCMYAPEFTSHSEGMRVKVGK